MYSALNKDWIPCYIRTYLYFFFSCSFHFVVMFVSIKEGNRVCCHNNVIIMGRDRCLFGNIN